MDPFVKMLFGVACLFLRINEGYSFPPPLSASQEREYFIKMRDGNEKERESARSALIEHNLRLVAHIVKKYYQTSTAQEDLISVGTIGLIKAIDSYKVDAGTRFATYAGKCLQNEILMYFRAQKKCQMEVSIDETIDVDRDGNPLTYMDIISTEDTVADDIYVKLCSKRAMRYINEALDARERKIIVMRYGLSGDAALTQREAAERLGISRSYVSRIEKSALSKLQKCLSEPENKARNNKAKK